MKSKLLRGMRSITLFLFNCFYGFITFFLVVLSGEMISFLLGLTKHISFGELHFQIGLLGAILQGSIYFFKSLKKLAQ